MPTTDVSSGPPVVILGGAVNALSAARSLGRRGVRVVALGESSAVAPVASSRFVSSYVPPPPTCDVQAGWLDWLDVNRVDAVVLPASDHGLEFVARHRASLVAWGHRPVEADDDLVLDLLDKQRTFERAQAAGVEAPRVVLVEHPDAVTDIGLSFPCALKAVQSHRAPAAMRAKGVVVESAGEAVDAVRAYGPLLASEIVPGPDDEFCSYYSYFVNGEPLFGFTKRKLRQYPVRWGTGTYHLAEHVPEAAELGLRLFRALGLVGLGNVEFKRDERDGRLKLIECNLRLTAADPLLHACGLDLPWLLYARVAGLDVDVPASFRYGKRQWHPVLDARAFLDYRRTDGMRASVWARSLVHRHRLPLWAADDPMPSVRQAAEAARVVARKAVRR